MTSNNKKQNQKADLAQVSEIAEEKEVVTAKESAAGANVTNVGTAGKADTDTAESSGSSLNVNLNDDESLLAALESALQADSARSVARKRASAKAAVAADSAPPDESTTAKGQKGGRRKGAGAVNGASNASMSLASAAVQSRTSSSDSAATVAAAVTDEGAMGLSGVAGVAGVAGGASGSMGAGVGGVGSVGVGSAGGANRAGGAGGASSAEGHGLGQGRAATVTDGVAGAVAGAVEAELAAATAGAGEVAAAAAGNVVTAAEAGKAATAAAAAAEAVAAVPLAAINADKMEQEGRERQGVSDPFAARSPVSSQGLLGVSRYFASKPAEQGANACGAGMLHLPNGQYLRLRQLLPEVAQLSPEVEKRLESEFEAGFAHYANEMLLTHSIEDLGGRPYAKFSPDYIKQLLQEHQPQLQTVYPFEILSLFTEPPELAVFQECLDFMLAGAHPEIARFAQEQNSHYMTIYEFYDLAQSEPELVQGSPDLNFLYRHLVDYLCYYEWFLAAVVMEFETLLTNQTLDEMIFYYYLLAQTSQDENDFIKYENLVTLQNLLKLFGLMRYGFVNESSFEYGVGYSKDAVEARISRFMDDPANYPQPNLRKTYNHVVGPDVYLSGDVNAQFIKRQHDHYVEEAMKSAAHSSAHSAQDDTSAASTVMMHELDMRLTKLIEPFVPDENNCTKAYKRDLQQLRQDFAHEYAYDGELLHFAHNVASKNSKKKRNRSKSESQAIAARNRGMLQRMEQLLMAVEAVRHRYSAFYDASNDKALSSEGATVTATAAAKAMSAAAASSAAAAASTAAAAAAHNASMASASSLAGATAMDLGDSKDAGEAIRQAYTMPSLADLDMRCAYTNLKEMRSTQPILLHFCYLRSVLDHLDEKGESEALSGLLQQITTLLSYRASMRFYGDCHQARTYFIAPLSHFLWGRKACRLGYEAMQEGSTKVANKDTLGLFLYELFSNVPELSLEQKYEYDFVRSKFSQKEIDEAIKTGECRDLIKEGALHLYHQLRVRQQLTEPYEQMQNLREDNPLLRVCPLFANKLIDLYSFYSKYKINLVRTILMEGGDERSTDVFANQHLAQLYQQVQAKVGAFGLDGNGNFIRNEKARQSVVDAVLQKSEREEAEHFLMGDTGFIPLVPGTSGHVAFLLGRAYTFGEMVDLNRYWGYTALTYAATSGEYRAPSYLALYYEPMFTADSSYQGLNVLILQLMGCMGMALASVALRHVGGEFYLTHGYEQYGQALDYNTAFKLWQERDSLLKPIFARNPTLLRREKLELLSENSHGPSFSAALLANTALLLCDILHRYPNIKENLEPILDRLMLLIINTMHQDFSPDCCLAMFRFIIFSQLHDSLQGYQSANDASNASFLAKLVACQLFFGESNVPSCAVVDDDMSIIHMAMMFLQLGMVSPEYREEGYNLLGDMLHSELGNFSALIAPYMDGYFKDATVLQNGAAFAYFSAINKVQHGAFPDATPASTTGGAKWGAHATTAAAAAAAAANTSAMGGAGAMDSASTAAGGVGSASGIGSASIIDGASLSAGSISGVAALGSGDASGAGEAALDCQEASLLFALLGRRFASDACYQDVAHFYQQQGLDNERLKLAYEMVALRRPYGYFELYLNLKDHEELKAEAHSYLFYAARMQVSEAQAEYEALVRTKSFKPLPFLIYWLYLEELAKTNLSALLCVLYLQISGLIVPINSHKIDDLMERHQQFFTQSQLNNILRSGSVQQWQTLQDWYRQAEASNYFDLFNQEDDNAFFMANEVHGNAATFNARREQQEHMMLEFFARSTSDPQVMAILLKMIDRLSMGQTVLERLVLSNLVHNSVAWPEPLPQHLEQAGERALTFISLSDSTGLDVAMSEISSYWDHLSYNVNLVSPLSAVLRSMTHPLCDQQIYKRNLLPCLNLGVMPNSLTLLRTFAQKAIRDDHRPLPLLFARMCRFLGNLGYLLPNYYSHSNMLMMAQEPYGELFERQVLLPYHRDLEQGAATLGAVAQKGELLHRLMMELQFHELHKVLLPDVAPEASATTATATVKAAASAKANAAGSGAAAGAVDTQAAGGTGAGVGASINAGAAGAADGVAGGAAGAAGSTAAGAGAGDEIAGATIEVDAVENHSIFDDLMRSLNEITLLLPEELSHLQIEPKPLVLSDFVAVAHDFVQRYQEVVSNALNDITSLDYEDYIYLVALFGAPLHLHAPGDYQRLMQHIAHSDNMNMVVRDKPCFVRLGETLALDLQRLKYDEYVDYAEVLKSYSVKYEQLLKYEQQIPQLKLQLPAIRFGCLDKLDLSSVAEGERHEMELFLHAYLQYEYYLHSHGFDLREILLFSRNGWTLGKTAGARMPQRSYASLLAKDMLRGVPEAAERYMYYRQSHLFKYVLDKRYFHEDEQHHTARKFVQEVLQLDLNSDKFKEFAQNMSSEGFDEFEKLRLEVENGAIENRYRFKYEDQYYDYLSGYISHATNHEAVLAHHAGAGAGIGAGGAGVGDYDADEDGYDDDWSEDFESDDSVVDPFGMDTNVACRAREQLKQMAAAVDALQACPPSCRELYFTRSDEQLRDKQTNNVLSLAQLSPDIHHDAAFYQWNAVELRVQLERILGTDNIDLLVQQPFSTPWLPYSFAHDGCVDLHQLLKTLPYPCTLLPSKLLNSLGAAQRQQALTYMQNLASEGVFGTAAMPSSVSSGSMGSSANLSTELSAPAAHSREQIASKLYQGELYAVELWGMSFDQRLSRWHRSKSELMMAIGREYSSYQQDFLRLRTYNSVYSEAEFQRYSFIWHLQRQQQALRQNHSSEGASVMTGVGDSLHTVIPASVSATVNAHIGPSYEQDFEHPDPWWEQAEGELLAALQNGEEYQGPLFNSAEYSEELLQNAKRQAQAQGQYFPSTSSALGLNPSRSEAAGSYRAYDDYSDYGDYSDHGEGQHAPAVVLATNTANKVAAVHDAKVQVGATASLWGSTNVHQARTLRQLLEYLGLDLDRVDISVKDQEAVIQSLAAAFNSSDAAAADDDAAMGAAATASGRAGVAGGAAMGAAGVSGVTGGVSGAAGGAVGSAGAGLAGDVGVGSGTSMNSEEALLFGRLKSFLTNKLGINIDNMGHDAIAAYAIEHLSSVEDAVWSSGAAQGEGQGQHKILRDEWDGEGAVESFRKLRQYCQFDLRQERQFTRPLMFYEEENPLHVLLYCLSQASNSGCSFIKQMNQEEKLADCLLRHSYFYGAVDLIDMSFMALLYEAHRLRFYRHLTCQQANEGLDDLTNMHLYGILSFEELEELDQLNENTVNSLTKKVAAVLGMPEHSPLKLLRQLLRLSADNLLAQCSAYYKCLVRATKEQYRRGLHVLLDDSYMHPLFFSFYDDPLLSLSAPSLLSKLYTPAFNLMQNVLAVALAKRQDRQTRQTRQTDSGQTGTSRGYQGYQGHQGYQAYQAYQGSESALTALVRTPKSLLLQGDDANLEAQLHSILQGHKERYQQHPQHQQHHQQRQQRQQGVGSTAVSYQEYIDALRTLRLGRDGSYQRLPEATPLPPSERALERSLKRGQDFCQWVICGQEIFINEDLLALYPDALPQLRALIVKLSIGWLFGFYEDERQLLLHQDLLRLEEPRKQLYPLSNETYWLDDDDEAEESYHNSCITSNFACSMLLSAQGKYKGKFDLSLPAEQVVENALTKMGLSAPYQALRMRRLEAMAAEMGITVDELLARGQGKAKAKGKGRRARYGEGEMVSEIEMQLRAAESADEKEMIFAPDVLFEAQEHDPDKYLELQYFRWKYYFGLAYKKLQVIEQADLEGMHGCFQQGCANVFLYKHYHMQRYLLESHATMPAHVPFVPEALATMLEGIGVPPARWLSPLAYVYRIGMRTGAANLLYGYIPVNNEIDGFKLQAWALSYQGRMKGNLYEQLKEKIDASNTGDFVDQAITCYYSMAYLHGLLLSPDVRAQHFLQILPAQVQVENVDFVKWLEQTQALPARMFFNQLDGIAPYDDEAAAATTTAASPNTVAAVAAGAATSSAASFADDWAAQGDATAGARVAEDAAYDDVDDADADGVYADADGDEAAADDDDAEEGSTSDFFKFFADDDAGDDDDDDDGETIVLSPEQAARLQDFLVRHNIDPFDTEGLANALVQCHLAQRGDLTEDDSADFDENQALSDIELDNAAYARSQQQQRSHEAKQRSRTKPDKADKNQGRTAKKFRNGKQMRKSRRERND